MNTYQANEYLLLLQAYEALCSELNTYETGCPKWLECYMRRASVQELLVRALLSRIQDRKAA